MHSPLRKHLNEIGKSMRGAALELGIEPHLFNAYVHGKRPNQRNAMRVARGLGVEVRTLWPDFDQNSLEDAIKSFKSRQRRFGHTSEQVLNKSVTQ